MPLAQRSTLHHVVIRQRYQQHLRDTRPDAFIMAATLPPELAHWVALWACNPAGMPKPIQEDEFSHLDLGDLDVWLWSCTMALKTSVAAT